MTANEKKIHAPAEEAGGADPGQPGGGKGRVDVTGVLPEGLQIDPNLTEGHPGYNESGNSEPHGTQGIAAEQPGSPG